MSTSTTTETRTMPSAEHRQRQHHRRGNRGGRGHHTSTSTHSNNRGAKRATANGRAKSDAASTTGPTDELIDQISKTFADTDVNAPDAAVATTEGNDDNDNATLAVCWICAEPVKYYSLSACNHRTCHVCALRLRALYKKLECTFCKEPQSTVIFTTSPDATFASYTPDLIPYKDARLAIFFETEDMMEETLILLRFNCPDPECDYTASGWGDLKLHTRATHGKVLCDLCIRSKKVFAHEHALYPPHILSLHLPSVPHRQISKQLLRVEQIEGGVHPLCSFCRECFFGDDELFVHMREQHEECFICKRHEIRDQYFQNYESLELHFSQAHFACPNTTCQAQKFVVFDSEIDLKAHQVEVHGADMSSRDKRDARRVQAEFEFDDAGGSGGGRRGRRDRGDREREREPPPPPPPQGPGQSRSARRREAFGGHLTTTTESAQVVQPSAPSGRASPIRDDVDPLIAERHAAFVARLQSVAPNANNAATAVKAAIRGYRANESSARDLISTVWNVLDQNLDDTASIINGVVDLLDEDEKKRDLLAAWNGFKIEQRQQFPDIVPTAVGSGYAGIASGRVLNAKHATTSRSSQQSSRQLWDRVAQAASASSSSSSWGAVHVDRFPPLPGPSSSGGAVHVHHTPGPRRRPRQMQTPWTSSSSGGGGSSSGPVATAGSTTTGPSQAPSSGIVTPQKRGRATNARPPPALSAAAFPELPTAQPRVKSVVSGNASLRHILGEVTPATSAWRANGSGSAIDGSETVVGTGTGTGETHGGVSGQAPHETTGGKGKKGKGKQKQMLFTLGSFPT